MASGGGRAFQHCTGGHTMTDQLTRLARRIESQHQQPHLLVPKNLPCSVGHGPSSAHMSRGRTPGCHGAEEIAGRERRTQGLREVGTHDWQRIAEGNERRGVRV